MKRPRYEQLSKAFVAGYTRRTATGQMVHVGGYHNRRTRRAAPLPTPERITAAYGDEVGRDTVTGARGDPFLIRQFGRGKRQAFVVHAANGEHIGTLRVAMGPRGAQVKDSWTHPQWGDRGVHVPMLRRLVADHAQVYSPAEMDPDLHRAWHALEGTHSVTQETHGAHIYHRLGPQEQAALFKSVEAGATRGPEGGELEKSLQKALAPVVQALVKSWPGERES